MQDVTIPLVVDGFSFELYYVNGMFENVKNNSTGKKMIVEIMQEGVGYKIHEHHGMLISGKVCDSRYVRIMELDVFVPKYLYIKNKE